MENIINIGDFVTIQEASRISKRSEGALRRRIHEGKLEFVKVGYAVLISKEAVEKLKKHKRS